MRKILFVPLAALYLLLLIAVCAFGQEGALTDSGKRVILKDDGTWAPVPADAAKDTGDWAVSIGTDPIDDSQRLIFSLSTSTSGGGLFADRVWLLLRYANGKTSVFVNWSDYLGSEPPVVTYRIDQERAATSQWSLSTDSKASFYPGDATQFARALMAAKQLVVRVTPYSSNSVTAVFDLRGLEAAAKQHADVLPWWPRPTALSERAELVEMDGDTYAVYTTAPDESLVFYTKRLSGTYHLLVTQPEGPASLTRLAIEVQGSQWLYRSDGAYPQGFGVRFDDPNVPLGAPDRATILDGRSGFRFRLPNFYASRLSHPALAVELAASDGSRRVIDAQDFRDLMAAFQEWLNKTPLR